MRARVRLAVVNLTQGGYSGGYRKYLGMLMPRLRAHPDIERLDIFAPSQVVAAGEHTWPNRDGLSGYRGLRKQIRDLRPDVVFIPTARWFDTGGTPTVVMVRNMEPLEAPFSGNSWPESAKNVMRARAARKACERADRVIAVSRHVRDFLQSRWQLDERRIGVVYHGIDPPAAEEPPRPLPLAPLGERPFLFTAGSIRPARGLEDLILAMAGDMDPERRVVVAGRVDPGAEAYGRRLRDLAQRSGVADRILWPGHLGASEMSWCFRNAALFVMTSRCEACPNTALEAMSHGTLTVSGENAPMPEFFGQAASYYRLGDGSSLATAIREALTLPADQKELLRVKGRQRARDFDWNQTAALTISEIRKVMPGSSSS
jgi:glycosyltransferase involved in cell wall biosynthesis